MSAMKDDSPIHILWLPTIAALGIAYIASFVDLLPDAIIGFGWLDDLVVFIGLVWFFTSWLPRNRHRIYWFRPGPKAGPQSQDEGAAAHDDSESKSEFDPFSVLNVRRGAAPGEIKHAYRDMLSKYHPDKVTHLGREFQQMAHDKSIEIKKAYEMLCGKE